MTKFVCSCFCCFDIIYDRKNGKRIFCVLLCVCVCAYFFSIHTYQRARVYPRDIMFGLISLGNCIFRERRGRKNVALILWHFSLFFHLARELFFLYMLLGALSVITFCAAKTAGLNSLMRHRCGGSTDEFLLCAKKFADNSDGCVCVCSTMRKQNKK